MILKSEIEKYINEAADELGYMVYDYSIYLKGENTKISVKIDKIPGITHKDCEMFSNRLGELLEYSEILPKYMLEISSPGLDRKLKSLDEIRRFQGEPMKLICRIDDENRTYKGIIMGISEDIIELNTENKKLKINYCSISDAYLDY